MLTTTLREKACQHCGTSFTPVRPLQRVCSGTCARHKVEADKKAEKAEHRAKLKASRETVAKLIAAAQIEFNAFIRERDKDKGCFVCGRPFENALGRVQHAGHVRSRSAAGHLRFHEDNCMGECEGCNGPHGAKPHQIKAGAIARIGQARYDALENDNEPIKWDRDVLRQIKVIYRAKTRALKAATPQPQGDQHGNV